VAASLGARAAATLTSAVMHVPVELTVVARQAADNARADGLVAAGGGSAVGLAKAVARETGLPILAVPTTYSGSEMTSIWGVSEGGNKRTGRDARVRPRAVIYDPDLTRTLPPALAGTSGLNAVAHAMEALYARGVDPITQIMAEEGVRALGESLPRVAGGEGDEEARARALYGAWLAAVCLDRAGMGVHHKICHVLGGSFGMPHAAVHAVMLPYTAAFNRDAAPEAMRRLARALSAEDAPASLFDLARRVGAPGSLAALGMKEEDLDRAAALATASPYENPRPVDRAGIRALLGDAFAGAAPRG
jgi:maleylacetate reductase